MALESPAPWLNAVLPHVMGNSAAQVCCYLVDDSAALGNPCGRENWSERFGVVASADPKPPTAAGARASDLRTCRSAKRPRVRRPVGPSTLKVLARQRGRRNSHWRSRQQMRLKRRSRSWRYPLDALVGWRALKRLLMLWILSWSLESLRKKFPTSGMGWGSGWSAKAHLKPPSKPGEPSRKEATHQFVYEIEQAVLIAVGAAGGSIDRLRCWRSGSLEQSAADAWLFECGILGRPQPIALELRGRMSAIDICDSDEDEALARKREAIRRRRQAATGSELPSSEEVPAAKPPVELPTGPWECPACGESNGEKRLKCNNCTRVRPGAEELVATPTSTAPAATGDATKDESRRKRRRGWDDWEEQAKQAAAKASTQNASIMKDVINSWKPTVDQLKAMTVAELGPVCKSWKISIEPKEYMRDVMLSKALKVIHGVDP
ncbi:unnamed protein product [Cladocopium goreaui]|uniref:RanBP2-type domain-containing protein n=1 Tax=Cladocopium goreaui TaxID=2562237 RepID=A0A9P1GS51_9DINO|nr:unnamed protein product [Cladocopium goreaui]